ncbi:DUF456 family protein [Pseudogracilibacillus sp. SE30717A]|uniref:DUF456 domain-containing protein n=1 Tax=Pseudogracilibacillus sp. SE30717A TaxID=3098293 RepID=UPI00300E4875
MEIIIWALIIVLFIVSMIGVFVPVIPAVALIWLGFILYHFFLEPHQLSVFFWVVMAVFTIILVIADLLTNRYFVNKFGGTKGSQWGAIIGVIIGTFIYPPLGIIVVPLILVFLIEMVQHKTAKEASLASVGALAGFLSGVIAKFLIQFIMIAWFFITIFLL